MMGLYLGVVAHACGGVGVLGPAHAYDTVVVTDGAVLRGTVTFQGTAPAPKEFELRRYPDQVFCGALSDGDGHRFLKEVHVGQGGGLKDVVVEANVCQFLPFVTVVSDKRQLTVTNRDPVSHDIQGYTYDQAGVDIVLHRPSLKATGTTDIVHLVKGRKVFTMQCGMHPYMQNWGYAIDNPYYAVTDQDGSYSIGDLSPGTYTVKAWHPILGVQERDLTIEANGTTTLDVRFNAK
jgi:hypothetical protein